MSAGTASVEAAGFSSRRNVLAAAAANGIGFAGFTLVMPFLPLYIRELGVTDVADIALWTGLTPGFFAETLQEVPPENVLIYVIGFLSQQEGTADGLPANGLRPGGWGCIRGPLAGHARFRSVHHQQTNKHRR